jgi:outer membrane autotransporter protein
VTLNGVIDGTFPLMKTGSGILALNASNNHSGGTFIQGGTLGVVSDASFGTPATNVTINNAVLQFNGSTTSSRSFILSGSDTMSVASATTATISGVISGVGASLVKEGPGILNLTAVNSYTNGTTISAGTLLVNGSIDGLTTVGSGGVLGGTGTVNGTLIADGIVAPGNSIGTLNVAGDYILNSGSIFQAEIDGLGNSDLLIATGNVMINPGAELQVFLLPSLYSNNLIYTLIEGASVSGTFGSVMLIPPRFQVFPAYFSNHVDILLKVVPYAQLISSGNAGSVASCFDTFNPDEGTDLAYVVIATSYARTVEALKSEFEQMQPALYNALAITQENTSIRVRSTFSQRTDDLMKKECAKGEREAKKWTVWGAPLGDFTHQGQTKSRQPSYHTSTGGGMIGLDVELPADVCLGAGGGYTYSDVEWNHDRGQGNINSYYGGLYGTWVSDLPVFAEFSAFGASNHYRASRLIKYANIPTFPINRKAASSHNGAEVASHLGFGYIYRSSEFDFSPFANVDYIYLHEKGYREHGAQSLDLRIKEKNSDLLRYEVGAAFSFCFSAYEEGTISPDIKLSWVREERFKGRKTEASFIDSACSFTVEGLLPSRNLFAPSIGFVFFPMSSNVSFSARYEGEFGRRFWQQGAIADVKIKF